MEGSTKTTAAAQARMPMTPPRRFYADCLRASEARLLDVQTTLFDEAETIAKEVNDHIRDAVKRGQRNRGIAMSARHHRGLWGPHLVWVRVARAPDAEQRRGTPAAAATLGRFTRALPMQSGISVRTAAFASVTEPLRTELLEFEARARKLRKIVRHFRSIATDNRKLLAILDAESIPLLTPNEEPPVRTKASTSI